MLFSYLMNIIHFFIIFINNNDVIPVKRLSGNDGNDSSGHSGVCICITILQIKSESRM